MPASSSPSFDRMKPIALMPKTVAQRIGGVLSDIDDTITTDGQLPAASYDAIERLRRAGFKVAMITGRPAGWCDMIARMWPVDAVVGENGAFYFARQTSSKGLQRVYHHPEQTRRQHRAQLDQILAHILRLFPHVRVASDQSYREADLAIDCCEDVDPIDPQTVDAIMKIFHQHGAQAKLSSIHINAWFGTYDKWTMTRRMAAELWHLDLDDIQARQGFVYCGDSPNDAPMFRAFPQSYGVANILHYLHAMTDHPTWIGTKRGAEGFVEFVDVLLHPRS